VCFCGGVVRQSLISHNDEVERIPNHGYAFSWLGLNVRPATIVSFNDFSFQSVNHWRRLTCTVPCSAHLASSFRHSKEAVNLQRFR
jgi:hypothetical protein